MPFYDYVCPECGHKETAMRKVAERDFPPLCVKHVGDGFPPEVRRVPMTRNTVTAPSFHLKGKGWAKDGYGK